MQVPDQNTTAGRKPGEVSQALLQAVQRLSVEGKGATLQELAAQTGVASCAARRALDNLRRAGRLCILGYRRVSYRNRPVAEYALPTQVNSDDACSHSFLARCWG